MGKRSFLTSTYTVSTVIAGLLAAAKLARIVGEEESAVRWKHAAEEIRSNLDKLYHQDGYFVKGFLLNEAGELEYDNTLDTSSLYGPFMYAGLSLSDERLVSTAQAR